MYYQKVLVVAAMIAITLLGCGCPQKQAPMDSKRPIVFPTHPPKPPHAETPKVQHCYDNPAEVEAIDGFVRFDGLKAFTTDKTAGWRYSPAVIVPRGWRELIVSWNAGKAATVGFDVVPEGHEDGFGESLGLGKWTMQPNRVCPRYASTLVNMIGDVDRDVVKLNAPVEAVQLILKLSADPDEAAYRTGVKLVTLSFFGGGMWPKPRNPNKAAWGKAALSVPKKAQLAYKGGVNWCSPSCVSMVMCYWARQLNKPELKVDVPQVVDGVRDSETGSTGVWQFNTAYVGTFPHLKAYVRRLQDITSLEDEIAAGRPVIISVDQNRLLGKDPVLYGTKGHLIVVTGFTKQGDVLVNDPWACGTKDPQKVQRVYKRKDVINAWSYFNSLRAAYLIEPPVPKVPKR